VPYDSANSLAIVFPPSDANSTFYKYEDGKIAPASDINNQNFYSNTYPTYLLSPSGNKTFRSVYAEGKNNLRVGDENGQNTNPSPGRAITVRMVGLPMIVCSSVRTPASSISWQWTAVVNLSNNELLQAAGQLSRLWRRVWGHVDFFDTYREDHTACRRHRYQATNLNKR
jgi:hypothetical protein